MITETDHEIRAACQSGQDIPITIAIEGDVIDDVRLENSLQMLESLQTTFSRGRRALEPYLDSAYAAYQRLEAIDADGPADAAERQRILETCEALEKLMRMSEKSRGCLESQTGFSLS